LLSLALLGAPALAKEEGGEPVKPKNREDPAAKPDAKSEDQPAGPAVTLSDGGEFFQLIESECQLDDKQRDKLIKVVEERIKALKLWDEKNAPQVDKIQAAIESARTKAHKQQLETQLASLQSQREEQARVFERKAVNYIKPEQKSRLFARLLNDKMTKEFSSITFTEKQAGQVKELCEKTAKGMVSIPEKTALNAMAKRIYLSILEKDQQKDYEKARRAALAEKQKENKDR